MRFQHGFVLYAEDGDKFIVDAFHDGQKTKYAHADCAYAAGARPHELRPGWCVVCDHQFFPQESSIRAQTGVLIEHAKLGVPIFYVDANGGAAHWFCAWDRWDWSLFQGLTDGHSSKNGR